MQENMKERLEGLYDVVMMEKLLDQVDSVVEDIQKDEPFEEADILEFITIKMRERMLKGVQI